MIELPRIALGTVQPQLNLQDLLWSLLEGMRRLGIESQVFSSQSRFDDVGSLATIDDRRLRHLDSWLMTPEVSRWLLLEGGQERDLSIVVGRFPDSDRQPRHGGSLNQLCHTLQLPSVVVLDVQYLDACRPLTLPNHTAALLLVGCDASRDVARWQTQLETYCCLPVLGGLCDVATGEGPRGAGHANQGRGGSMTQRVRQLGDDFLRHVRWGQLLELARNAAPLPLQDPWSAWPERQRPLRVAMAYDEVFNCYFPDTMDCLEMLGAELIDFSPLKSECLPEGVDLVWFGCGHAERCPDRLSRNICLRHSLQAFVRAGGRVYAEGGGLAYVCETMHCQAGSFPMAGILPADAHYQPIDAGPVDLPLVGRPWFGQRRVRGYLNPSWSLVPREGCTDYSARSSCPRSLVGCQGVLGSRVHVHFGSQPQLLQSIWASDPMSG